MEPQNRSSKQQLKPAPNRKQIPKPQSAKRPPSITTSLFAKNQSTPDNCDKSDIDRIPQLKTDPSAEDDSQKFRAKVSIKNKDKIAKESSMKRAKLVIRKVRNSDTTAASDTRAKKIRKTEPLKSRTVSSKARESRFKNLQNYDTDLDAKNGSEHQTKEAKTKLLPQYKQGPSYKKKAGLSPFIPICEFFLGEANCSSFNKLVKFYEKDLKEPLFALMLKKFFIKFKGNEKYKENLELRKFFYRLRFCKGVTSILKNLTPKPPAEVEAQAQTQAK